MARWTSGFLFLVERDTKTKVSLWGATRFLTIRGDELFDAIESAKVNEGPTIGRVRIRPDLLQVGIAL